MSSCRQHTIKYLALMCLLLAAMVSHSQQYLARNYTAQDGLSHPNVYRIYEDKRGFLWFSTDYGITRYDGQTFTSSFNDSAGLLNNSILSIFEDGAGTSYASSYKAGMMVMTDSGVAKFKLTSGTYPSSVIQTIMGEDGAIWVLGKPEVSRITGSNLTQRNIMREGRRVWFVNATNIRGHIVFCTSEGIYKASGKDVVPFLPEIIHDTVTDVADDKNNGYWVACRRRIVHLVAGAIKEEYKLEGRQMAKQLLFDSHKNLWVALDGEGILQLKDGMMTDITARLTLGKTVVNDMLEDSEGNIWLATYGAGLFKISSLGMLSYKPYGDNASIFCRSACVFDEHSVLIASIGKLSVWRNNEILPYPTKKLRPDQYIYFVNRVGNKLYIGTSVGLLVKDIVDGNEQYVPLGYDKTYAGLTMYTDKSGVIRVGNYSTLLRIEDGILMQDTSAGSGVERYNAICQDAQGNMWYGTDREIILVDNTGKISKPFAELGSLQVSQIITDRNGRVWVATFNGLLMYDHGRKRIFRKEDGLGSNKCNTLLEDSNGRIWVGTLGGLNYIKTGTLEVLKCNAGLYNDDVLSLCCLNDRLFAGSVNRLVSVDLNDVEGPVGLPPLYITSVRTATREYIAAQNLQLAYNDNKLTINFIALSYQASGEIEYRYKIEGLYDKWTTTKNNHLELSALPSGSYRILLNARRGNGPWTKDVVLTVTIATPFWKTWSFFLLLGLVLVTIVVAVIKTVEARRRKQLVLRNKMAYLKQQALSALINPHFMFNCLNSIQYYLDANENDKANAYLADFAHLIRLTLDDAQKVYISLDKELSRIEFYLQLEQLRFGDELKYHIDLDTTLDTKNTYIPNMILQPYVENAIWHGIMPNRGKGNIWLSFKKGNDRELQIIVQDDGVGLNYKKDDEKIREGHYGMSLTEERLKLLNRLSDERFGVHAVEILDEHGKVRGTRIEITVTVKDNYGGEEEENDV